MEIDVAGTSKELDPATSLYYFGARYYVKHPSDSAWSVEDAALFPLINVKKGMRMPQSGSGSRWMSVDPLAEKYQGWGSQFQAGCYARLRIAA